MKKELPKYVYRDTDRYGKVRYYFRPPGASKTAVDPTDPGFKAFYDEAMASRARSESQKAILPKTQVSTLRWLCDRYFASRDFEQLDQRTKRVRRQIMEHCLRETIRPGATEVYADFPLEFVTTRVIKTIRDTKGQFPEAANSRVKAFRQVFAWAIEAEIPGVSSNPARDVKYLKNASQGFHAWTIDDLERFEDIHPIGTKARLAFALLLYTGQRRADIVAFGRQHLRDEWLRFTQHKNRNRKPVRLEIPVIPELRRIIDLSPTGDLTFLVTAFGKPFTSNGFGNRMRKWCDEAGLTACSAHGLRKAAAARLAELGCSDREIMAITGHTTQKEVDRYTKGVRQRRLAENVLSRINRRGD